MWKFALLAVLCLHGSPLTLTPPQTAQKPVTIDLALDPIGISSHRDALKVLLNDLLMEKLEAGDTVLITDPATRQRLWSITLSPLLTGKTTQQRRLILSKAHSRELAQLKKVIQSLEQSSSEGTPAPLYPYLFASAALRGEFPQNDIHLVFLGNPISDHPNPLFSFKNRYLSDGHFSNSLSPYNTIGQEQFLKGFFVHVIHSPDLREFSAISPDRHRRKTQRFAALFCKHTSAQLLSFGGTLEHLRNIRTLSPLHPEVQVDPDDQKLRSYEFLPPQVAAAPESTTTPEATRGTSLIAQETALYQQLEPEDRPPILNIDDPTQDLTGHLSVGVRWEVNADIDIYVQVAGGKELSYLRQRDSKYEGVFLKDHRSKPSMMGFETVVFQQPVPLRELQPIWINLFSGSVAGPFEVEIRLQFGEHIYTHTVTMNCTQGNGGEGHRSTDAH